METLASCMHHVGAFVLCVCDDCCVTVRYCVALHLQPTAEDWQAVAVTMASAQQLTKMELWEIDVPFLEACLPSLSSCPSLQKLRVYSDDPSECYVL